MGPATAKGTRVRRTDLGSMMNDVIDQVVKIKSEFVIEAKVKGWKERM
jgi:phage baseplate assembly protein W